MIRFTLLRFRTQVAVAVGGLVIVAVVLLATGFHLAHAYDTTISTCKQQGDCTLALSTLPASWEVIEESHTDRQSVLLVRTEDPILDPAWTVRPVSLEDMVLAYMSQSADATRARRPGLEVAS